MHAHPMRSLFVPPTAANEPTAVYLVYAVVVEVSGKSDLPDPAMLSKLLSRRLNRLERVVDEQGGWVLHMLPQGLLSAFDSAEDAVLVASEMQRRCAVIPQISETQIGLRIGIHVASPGSSKDGAFAAAENEAKRLAGLLDEGNVVVSAAVVKALPDSLREHTAVPGRENFGLGVHLIEWNSLPMRPAPPRRAPASSAKAKKASTELILRQGDRCYRFVDGKRVITIGRDPENDVVTYAPNASRLHCQIISRADDIVLVDLSMNGTYVQLDDKPEQVIRKSMFTLTGRGRISFGHSNTKHSDQVFEFEIR